YGTPKNPTDQARVDGEIAVSTHDPSKRKHGIYFNRGVAASQAYTAKFGAQPDKLPADKKAQALAWLSRGLHEALTAFISRGASKTGALRAAAFEFSE